MRTRHDAGVALRGRGGFTLIELLIVVLIIVILIAILVPSLAAARNYARKAKDSTHIRAIVQGFGAWATSHQGSLPRPSALDASNKTLEPAGNDAPAVKDNTGNILSVLLFNGLVQAKQMIAPQEANASIQLDEGYELDSASRAREPSQALWDPGFAGYPGERNSFTGVPQEGRRSETVGNTSYATAMPFGDRLSMWKADFGGGDVLAGNRGPQYIGTPGSWTLAPNRFGYDRSSGQRSNTLRFYGPDDVWHGHVGFGDGHVDFFRQPDPAKLPMSFIDGGPEGSFGDNVFVNENDNVGWDGQNSRDDQSRPGRWTNAFIRPYGDVRAPVGDVSDPQVGLFFD